MRVAYQGERKVLSILAGTIMMVLSLASIPAAAQYLQTNLVSDLPNIAPVTDRNLVNPWGIVASSRSPFWISDNGTGLSTLYTGAGGIVPLVVTIPAPAGGSGPAKPTGIVFNNTTDFIVSKGPNSGPSAFIFATEDGTISGWNNSVDRNNAILKVDNSAPGGPDGSPRGAIYKGLAIGNNGAGNYLYATNFSDGTVEMYDGNFNFVKSFTDPRIKADAATPGYAPFGIHNINGLLFVTFAKQDAAREDDVAGRGLGFIDVFDMGGDFLGRLVTGGALNAPWGLALAPANFGQFSGRLLVGNFGDGRINAYDLFPGNTVLRLIRGLFRGTLSDANGNPISIDGLWGLSFGNGVASGATNQLFFTAGIQDEAHGLYGMITAQ
jgi:uncharacterized protein (TIGR03118 family)